jgi:chemotaxis signal transduction protein
MNNEAIERKAVGGGSRKLQIVQAGQDQFGIFADQISVIVEWQEPAPLPHAPTSVLGVVCIQGRMLTVLDLGKLAGAEAGSADSPRTFPRHLIALRGDEQLALAVEGLGEVVQLTGYAPDLIDGRETAGGPVLVVWEREEAEIKILNPKGLFPAAIQGRERRQRRF